MKIHFKIITLFILIISLSIYVQKQALGSGLNPFDQQTESFKPENLIKPGAEPDRFLKPERNGLKVSEVIKASFFTHYHEQEGLAVEFVANHLEGLGKDWNETGTQHNAYHTSVLDGTYVFRAKGSNNEGIFNEPGTAIKITVLPPLWQTGWAYILCAIMILAIILNSVRLQRQKFMKKQQVIKGATKPIPPQIYTYLTMVAGSGRQMNHLVNNIEKLTTPQSSVASYQLPEPQITDHCSLTTEKVLVVDDDPVTRQVLVNYLSLQHYTIYQAASGIEALAFLGKGQKPDLILLDVMMPHKSGYEVTQIIRETWSADELPIILLTAKNQVADLVAGLESGANDYMTKPVSTNELLARIKTHLHIRRLKMETLRLAIENKNRLTQFLESVPVGIVIFEVKGPFFYFNQKVQQILGTESSELIATIETIEQFVLAYPFYIAGTEQLYPTDKLPFVQALKGETSTINNVAIHQADKIIPLEICGNPIFDEEDKIIYVINTLQDITERKMALEAQEKLKFTKELFQLNKAYERFVPSEFLSLLNKQSIVDVNFGDHVEKEMTIMFADIRGFTTLSENLSPQEIFDFINAYLSKMEPLILEHHGIIDKYIGDAIMALFPTNADDAVQGAIAMLKALTKYNQLLQSAGLEPMQIGIGLNTGPLMLGTVGGKNRMDGTVIADAVNVASRVEGLTKIYGTPLLITEQTYLNLAHPSRYHIRVIDAVKVKGKSEEVTVYEIFDAEPLEKRALKDQTSEDFETGFALYHWEEYQDALPCFESVLQINENDEAAQVYLERCQNKLGLTLPPSSTVLIVDDTPANIRMLFGFLTQHNFKILTAESGSQVLQVIQYESPDLILLDVMMPDMDGFETCRRLKANSQTHDIPIVLMTDLVETVDKAKGFELGAVDYITKPFQLEEVLARINTHLKLIYLQQQLQAKNSER